MENTSYIALSTLTALSRQMDVLANNIANANTTAFRAERVLFEEYLADIGDGQTASFVIDYAVVRDNVEGEIGPTGNPLDLAISGEGYLVVNSEDGPRYTRNGHLKLRPDGTIVALSGDPVLDVGGRPISLPAGDTSVAISSDGVVSSESGTQGQLSLVFFENEHELRKQGDGLYVTDAAPLPAVGASVLQGMIEGSNVEPIIEMTEMIRLVRRYQATQRILEQIEQLERQAINELSGS